jgi:D-alanyl-D-alanine carboxypeptidase
MKTGFTCSSGFNVVLSATRNGRKLIAVVMGSPSSRERNLQAAQLLERGFAQEGRGPSVADLPKSKEAEAPDMRSHICSRRNAAAVEAGEEEVFGQPKPMVAVFGSGRGSATVAIAPPPLPSPQDLLSREPVRFDPVPVFVGPKPGWTGPVLAARPAPSAPSDANAYTTATAKSPPADEAPLVLQGVVKPPEAAAAVVKKAAHAAAHAPHAAVKDKAKVKSDQL